jgi:hypothetical protein
MDQVTNLIGEVSKTHNTLRLCKDCKFARQDKMFSNNDHEDYSWKFAKCSHSEVNSDNPQFLTGCGEGVYCVSARDDRQNMVERDIAGKCGIQAKYWEPKEGKDE